jgi:hypothetical protein
MESKMVVNKTQANKTQANKTQANKTQANKTQVKLFLLLEVTLLLSLQVAANSRRARSLLLSQPALRAS